MELPQGIINYSNNTKFMHNCNTVPGNSGAPILLINNIKIIGIHTGYIKTKNKNVGLFFHNILKFIKNDQNEKEKEMVVCQIVRFAYEYNGKALPGIKIQNPKKDDWWRLCKDFCNVYRFFSISKKYSEFARVRDDNIINATKKMRQDISILKAWVISIIPIFLDEFKVDTNLNVSFKNTDSKLMITKKSLIIIAFIRKYLESLIINSTKLENIPENVQIIIYNYIKDNGYFPEKYLSTYLINRIDFNFFGGRNKLKDDQVGMILAFLIISRITVQVILLHIKDNFKDFNNYPNIDITAKYIGSIMHYLTRDTFSNDPEMLKDVLVLMNYYRNYHIYNKALESQDLISNDMVFKDEDEFAFYLIPKRSITKFWSLNANFVETFKNYVYSWACRLGKLINSKYQKKDKNFLPKKKLEKPKDRLYD